jgi:hypothetical protein
MQWHWQLLDVLSKVHNYAFANGWVGRPFALVLPNGVFCHPLNYPGFMVECAIYHFLLSTTLMLEYASANHTACCHLPLARYLAVGIESYQSHHLLLLNRVRSLLSQLQPLQGYIPDLYVASA